MYRNYQQEYVETLRHKQLKKPRPVWAISDGSVDNRCNVLLIRQVVFRMGSFRGAIRMVRTYSLYGKGQVLENQTS